MITFFSGNQNQTNSELQQFNAKQIVDAILNTKVQYSYVSGTNTTGKTYKFIRDFIDETTKSAIIEQLSKCNFTPAQVTALKNFHVINFMLKYELAGTSWNWNLSDKSTFNVQHERTFEAHLSQETFEKVLKAVVNHNFTEQHIQKLDAYFSNMWFPDYSAPEYLSKILTNYEKYDQPTQPWSAWFGEFFGYREDIHHKIADEDFDFPDLNLVAAINTSSLETFTE